MGKKLTTKEFIARARKVHGDKYDYSKTIYNGNYEKIIITCPEHGDFTQTPNKHMRGRGCRDCTNNRTFTTEEFIKNAKGVHGDRYDYSESVYVNCHTKLTILCKIHGRFIQEPRHHTEGRGCPKCSVYNQTKSNNKFIQEANYKHNKKYTYIDEYTGAYNKITISCPIHGIFQQIARDHLRGSGCPKCKSSIGESYIECFLSDKNIKHIKEHKFIDCRDTLPLPFDFYLPEHNMCIEYDGIQHHEPVDHFGGLEEFHKTQNRDNIKNYYCIDNNIKLLRIPYWDFQNINEILERELK